MASFLHYPCTSYPLPDANYKIQDTTRLSTFAGKFPIFRHLKVAFETCKASEYASQAFSIVFMPFTKAHLVATFWQLKIKLAVIKVNAALSVSYPSFVLFFPHSLSSQNCLQSAADRKEKNKVSYFASWKMQQGANQA